MWYQQTLTLSAKPRGFHLVTDEVIGQIRDLSRVKTGLLHLLLQHTSASLTLNENCDPTVRSDMERHFLKTVPDNAPYDHDYEGADDMPSHIKSSLLGGLVDAAGPQRTAAAGNVAGDLAGRTSHSRWFA